MPITLQWEPRGVVRAMTGEIGADELLESVADLQNDPRFDQLRFLVEDFSEVESVQLDEAGLDMVIATTIGAAFSNPHIRIAVVATTPPVRSLARQFAEHSPYVTQIFQTLAAARVWIAGEESVPVPLDVALQAAVHP